MINCFTRYAVNACLIDSENIALIIYNYIYLYITIDRIYIIQDCNL